MAKLLEPVGGHFDALLERLSRVVAELPDEALSWRPGDATTNSVAQIVRHTVASTDMLFARMLGETPQYDHGQSLREEAATAAELRELLAAAKVRKGEGLVRLAALDLDEAVPTLRGAVPRGGLLLQALGHAREHVGHAELTAQLWRQRGSA